MFTTTPSTAPPWFYSPLATVSYNNHTNQVWYAYTTLAYSKLLKAEQQVFAHLNYGAFIGRQLACAPSVWFGFTRTQDAESYGHEYGLIADFVLHPSARRDAILAGADTVIWTLALLLAVLGSFLLLYDRAVRYRFLPLLLMLGATIFVNFCNAWVRMLLPVYPVIFVAIGVGVAFIVRKAHHTSV
jgi:hypothetical protein